MDGILNKLESLENLIQSESPSVLFFQETKCGRSGRIKTPSSKEFSWYELHRSKEAEKGEMGGGLAIGVLNMLDPSYVSEGDDEAEANTVEIWVEGFPVRLVCGYGPQEYDRKERKKSFWGYLNSESQKAKEDDAGLIIQMDGNLWAGNKIIPSDVKVQNQNGKYFEEFLFQNQHLSVLNALQPCEGDITRVRHTTERTEESILDFFIVCNQILPVVTKMKIDKNGETTLTRFRGKTGKSDHKMLKLEIDLNFHEPIKHERKEVFNVRNKVCQKVFYEFTSKSDMFIKCFSSPEETVDVQFKR